MKSLAEKLNLKPGYTIYLKGKGIEEFPELMHFHSSGVNEAADFILLWVENSTQLEILLAEIQTRLKPETIFWIAYPKKSSGKTSDLHRDQGWEPLKAAGWRPVSQVSMNDVWTALRFKPGIWPDLSTSKPRKELVLPPEMMHFLENERLLDIFQALSYTHRKEYIEAFEEAKKPETRHRRLAQLAEKLKAGNKKN